MSDTELEKKKLWRYFSRDLKWGENYEAHLVFDFLCQVKKLSSEGILLDYGSGFKRYAPFFDNTFLLAQEHPESGKKNKNIVDYDILSTGKIPLKDSSIDVVLSTSSLEHLENPHLFFQESFRVLRAGGSIAIQCPFAFSEHEIPYDFQRLTRFGLMRDLTNAGFELEISDIRPLSSTLTTINTFMMIAIKEDIVGNTRNTIKSQIPKLESIKSKKIRSLAQEILYWLLLLRFLLKNQIVSRVFLIALAKLFKWVSKLVDKGPSQEKSFMPVGWIVIAKKTGNLSFREDKLPYLTDRESALFSLFLETHDFQMQKGRIVQTQYGYTKIGKLLEKYLEGQKEIPTEKR